jgi:dephospho-CoA kinase
MSKYHVIYLTGSPAAGKTTLTNYLKHIDPSLLVFEYGKVLTNLISKKNNEVKKQEILLKIQALNENYEIFLKYRSRLVDNKNKSLVSG